MKNVSVGFRGLLAQVDHVHETMRYAIVNHQKLKCFLFQASKSSGHVNVVVQESVIASLYLYIYEEQKFNKKKPNQIKSINVEDEEKFTNLQQHKKLD